MLSTRRIRRIPIITVESLRQKARTKADKSHFVTSIIIWIIICFYNNNIMY